MRTYRLLSRCSDKYVQMKLGDKKRAVDAKGLKNSDYGKLLRHIFLFVTSRLSLISDVVTALCYVNSQNTEGWLLTSYRM